MEKKFWWNLKAFSSLSYQKFVSPNQRENINENSSSTVMTKLPPNFDIPHLSHLPHPPHHDTTLSIFLSSLPSLLKFKYIKLSALYFVENF